MELNVAQLLKEPIGAERHYRLDLKAEEAHYLKEVQRVEGEVRLLRVPHAILVTGKVKALVEMVCGRCLESFRQAVSFDLQEEYYPVVDVSSGTALPPPEDASAFTIGPDHVLDLREALRQYALLALPMKPVCLPDCRGLCPQCGANLNLGPCPCPAPSPDPRLAALEALRERLV